MTTAERDELVNAVERGEVHNASAFAEAFAAKHGLNASTVRSTISRMRRERGLIAGTDVVPAPGRDVTRILNASNQDRWAVQIAAAALVKYQADDAFRRAVDRERKELDSFYKELVALQTRALTLFDTPQRTAGTQRKQRRPQSRR
jgi:hypothetical protein